MTQDEVTVLAPASFLSSSAVMCQRLCSHSGALCSFPERYTAIKSAISSVYSKLQHRAERAKLFFFVPLVREGDAQCVSRYSSSHLRQTPYKWLHLGCKVKVKENVIPPQGRCALHLAVSAKTINAHQISQAKGYNSTIASAYCNRGGSEF